MQSSTSPVAAAAEAAGASPPELATLLGISESAAWDVLTQPDELSVCLSLRQLLHLSTRLRVPTLSLLPEPSPPPRERRSFTELAADIRAYCGAHHLSIEQLAEQTGWDVQQFLAAPDSALDDWCLDALTEICCALGLHWPDYLPK